MQRGRRIAFDYGDVRIGVAVSDSDAILASPLATLRSSDKKLAPILIQLFQEYQPIRIYVGRPSNMDGTLGEAADKCQKFCELLELLTAVPVVSIDERLTTVSASRNLKEAGLHAKAAKSRIDPAAAVAILEFGLALEKSRE